jgi:cytochrome c
VYLTCRACHALEQFTDRQLPREDWDDILDKMVEKNGMAAPVSWARRLMVNYPSTHFGEEQEEGWDGLPPGPGPEEVYYTCNACQSLKLVMQQGLSRERWDDTLDWMLGERGMDAFDDIAVRGRTLNYLPQHFNSG